MGQRMPDIQREQNQHNMLQAIRKLNSGWILLLTGLLAILSGISMTEVKAGQKTLLCFDTGCIYVQGVTNVVVGCLIIGYGIYLIMKK